MMQEGWAVLTVACFWGWIGATTGLILNAFPARGRLHLRSFRLWGGAVVLFYALWVLAMTRA